MVGRTILQYRITEKLGEGGMGVVYKAEDTQLRRTVALKFIPRETLDEVEVKARLLREAQAAASLDHPNICQVFGIHEEDGETFIAMAYIDGPSLADKIKERPLPLDEALAMAAQIAEGLHEAHEQGVVHRDIKPQNILLTAKGQVKILDFGLASLTGRSKLTKTGTTMGTPAYMAPEQLDGRKVDRRADVWALGCVLYEMLTQKTPFEADYEQAIGYGILNEDPEPVTALRRGLPPKVDDLLAKALAKDRDERYQHADELLADLRVLQKHSGARKTSSGRSVIAATTGQVSGAIDTLPPDSVVVKQSSLRALQASLAALAIGVLGILLYLLTVSEPATDQAVRKFSFNVAGIPPLAGGVISPDGRHIVYAVRLGGRSSLWLRSLEDERARELPGTEGAIRAFWSPDSEFVGFGVGNQEFTLKRVSIEGGSPLTLCVLPTRGQFAIRGGTWSPDGERIVFASGQTAGNLYQVPARGGEPRLLFVDGIRTTDPHFLPSGALVYSSSLQATDQVVVVFDFQTGESKELAPGAEPFYSPEGFLVLSPPDARDTGLRALPFDLETLSPTAEAFPIAEGGRLASVSLDGALVFSDSRSDRRTLLVRDRAGETLEVLTEDVGGLNSPAVSPDGTRVASTQADSIWAHDLETGIATRLSAGVHPSWGPTEAEVSFLDGQNVMVQPADGSRPARVLFTVDGTGGIIDWARDGRRVVYAAADPAGGEGGLWYRELQEDGTVSDALTLLRTPSAENHAALSPDGSFVAYQSDESGRFEIYIRPFPSGGGKWQVSANGGVQPRWSSSGAQLFYVEGTALMLASVVLGSEIATGVVERIFELGEVSSIGYGMSYDVFPDHRRIAVVSGVEEGDRLTAIRVVENWHEEFRDREQ